MRCGFPFRQLLSDSRPRGNAADSRSNTSCQRHFISHVLAFFAASDGIVNENLLEVGRLSCQRTLALRADPPS